MIQKQIINCYLATFNETSTVQVPPLDEDMYEDSYSYYYEDKEEDPTNETSGTPP